VAINRLFSIHFVSVTFCYHFVLWWLRRCQSPRTSCIAETWCASFFLTFYSWLVDQDCLLSHIVVSAVSIQAQKLTEKAQNAQKIFALHTTNFWCSSTLEIVKTVYYFLTSKTAHSEVQNVPTQVQNGLWPWLKRSKVKRLTIVWSLLIFAVVLVEIPVRYVVLIRSNCRTKS